MIMRVHTQVAEKVVMMAMRSVALKGLSLECKKESLKVQLKVNSLGSLWVPCWVPSSAPNSVIQTVYAKAQRRVRSMAYQRVHSKAKTKALLKVAQKDLDWGYKRDFLKARLKVNYLD